VRRPVLVALALVLMLAGCDDENHRSRQAAPKKAEPRPGPTQKFQSRPDLEPPQVRIDVPARRTAPGYVFLGPKLAVRQAGPMILDNLGQIVWFHPLKLTKGITDFRVQRYHGRRVLTWWRGKLSNRGVGDGWYVIYDDRYRPIAEVHPGHGLVGDVHEFLITERDTALITIYHRRPLDLTPVGGPAEGKIWDGIVQEIDIASGRVLFEWHSYPQVGIEESYARSPKRTLGTKALPYDYIHLNSIDVDSDGNLIVSGRNTHAIYKIDRRTGRVLWRLGGKRSDFALGPGVRFAWQHDARRQPDGTITIFDNGAAPAVEKFSRVLVIRAQQGTRRATLARSYRHPKKLLAPFEGNAQFLDGGHVFVGWGGWPYATELDRRGKVLFDVYFGHGKPAGQDADSYRAYRFVWHGHPADRPALAVKRRKTVTALYASWNGATELRRWVVLAGGDPDGLQRIATRPKQGFETTIEVGEDARFYAVQAVDARGKVLGRSEAIEARG
jgi:Arylsulfotransferase (ASST)